MTVHHAAATTTTNPSSLLTPLPDDGRRMPPLVIRGERMIAVAGVARRSRSSRLVGTNLVASRTKKGGVFMATAALVVLCRPISLPPAEDPSFLLLLLLLLLPRPPLSLCCGF